MFFLIWTCLQLWTLTAVQEHGTRQEDRKEEPCRDPDQWYLQTHPGPWCSPVFAPPGHPYRRGHPCVFEAAAVSAGGPARHGGEISRLGKASHSIWIWKVHLQISSLTFGCHINYNIQSHHIRYLDLNYSSIPEWVLPGVQSENPLSILLVCLMLKTDHCIKVSIRHSETCQGGHLSGSSTWDHCSNLEAREGKSKVR